MPASCPVCKRRLNEETAEPPFCSKRCRLVDLGRWLDGDYRIPDDDPSSGAFPDAGEDEEPTGTGGRTLQ